MKKRNQTLQKMTKIKIRHLFNQKVKKSKKSKDPPKKGKNVKITKCHSQMVPVCHAQISKKIKMIFVQN